MKILQTLFVCIFLISENVHANVPVIDVASVAQLAAQFNQLVKIYGEMSDAQNHLARLKGDSLKWESFEFNKYRNSLISLTNDIDIAKDIISDLNKFQNLYPGFDVYSIRKYSDLFNNRSTSLLNLLGKQIDIANDALANQKDINVSDTSNAAAVANLTLASLSNLNSQVSAEIRAANTYRAYQIQNEVDKKTELQRFIGQPYKKYDSSKYKTCVGECS